MKILESYFDLCIAQKASDLHLVGAELPTVRIEGELKTVSETPLDNEGLKAELLSLCSEAQRGEFEKTGDLDFAHEYKGQRFRLNIHMQDKNIGMSCRLVPSTIPSPEELGFEAPLKEFIHLRDGLVLVVGPTGHGKSTTIASMVEQINQTRKSHIITIEDPIEFLFKDKLSLIEQREVGADTISFASALKHVLRQDPNVIVLGEMRDPDTISTALSAAETGHLVFSTLHTSSAAEAIERIIDAYEGSKQKQILIQLSSVLRGVVAQHLLPTLKGARVAVREILVNTPAVANLIRTNNITQLYSAIETGLKDGMITMEHSLAALFDAGLISRESADAGSFRHKKMLSS
ncbi:MAG: PilT/PilU family type 4a pilus ATPase [Candidatus Magasanikbacteria bacterium]|nr:PilT/PilU family type 4a pilus ATPase [Candidatus Magasanikbacteria bacterium]